MEDDISIQEEVEFLKQVKPKIDRYINEKFGETKEISSSIFPVVLFS